MKQSYKTRHAYLLSFLFAIGLCSITNAQVSLYTFSQSVGTYTPITGGTVLGNATTNDQRFVDPAVPLGGTTITGVGFPIGFNFTYDNIVFDRVAINANGWISLGQSSLTPSVNNSSANAFAPLSSTDAISPVQLRDRIAGMARNLEAQTGAELRIETIGTAPNRIFVVQWRNYKKFGTTTGAGDNLNFQIRLNETSNIVEVVYGTVVFNTVSFIAQVGLGGSVSTDFNNRTTTTDWNATTPGVANTAGLTMLNTVTVPVSGRTFKWTPPVLCTGSPAPGNTISNSNPVCLSAPFSLSLQVATPGSGVTYQWQSSPDGTIWTNIPTGGTLATFNTSQTVATYYRANVTCGVNTTPSNALQVTMTTLCYCAAGGTSATSALFEKISNVTFNTINNNSSATTPYENFTAISTTVSLGITYPISVTISGAFPEDQVIVFVDYNQNGNFTDPGETVFTSPQGIGPHISSFTIPATATLGTTRMRVRMHDATLGPNPTSCGNSDYGQVEDYTLNIVACITAAVTTQPANATVVCTNNTSFTVAVSGTTVTYQWQVSTDGGTSWNNLSNTAPYSGVTTATLSLTSPDTTYNNYRYRVILNNNCTTNLTSNAATLTVNLPPSPGVAPLAATICLGSSPSMLLTVSSAPPTTTVSSGLISINIPDNNVAGINHTLNVTSVPAAAVVTTVKVQFTIPHTWAGDLVIVLKAPNGQILNLDYFLTETGGGVTTGFTNTIISSVGVTALSAGTDPWTGIFKADAFTGIRPAGPTGSTAFLPTTASYPALFTTPNGPWTLAIYDGFTLDVGTLSTWSVTLDYTLPPASATFTPITGLYTDANATVAYTGNVVSQVYARPTITTTYGVTTGSGACVSAPTNVIITVFDPPAVTTQPANKSACVNGSTTFIVVSTGSGITYQWQQSTDAGTTWINLVNGTNYSGVTTSSLTVQNVPASWNNFRYRVVLTGSAPCGSLTSNAAILTVNLNLVLVVSANPSTRLYPGIKTILTVAVSPNAPSNYTWFRNGVAVAGATGNMLEVNVDQLGDYTVRVTDVNGCSSLSSSLTIADSVNSNLFIYPSPNTGQFQVRYYSSTNDVLPRMLTIYDSKGARVFSKTYTIGRPYERMDVDMRNHGKGIYIVELSDRNGTRLKTGRVVIN